MRKPSEYEPEGQEKIKKLNRYFAYLERERELGEGRGRERPVGVLATGIEGGQQVRGGGDGKP